jgi:hypothetical protein
MMDRDKYGSRNYQIILRRLQLLPCSSYLNASAMDVKGKRKASEGPEDGGSAKKKTIGDEDCDMNA